MIIKETVLRLILLLTLIIAIFGTIVIGFDNDVVQDAYFAVLIEVLGYYTIFQRHHKK